jgi:hypothetical protein
MDGSDLIGSADDGAPAENSHDGESRDGAITGECDLAIHSITTKEKHQDEVENKASSPR